MNTDGWIAPSRGETGALSPRGNQVGHEPPLRSAGVLELVDEHVVIARFEPVAALRELVHAAEQPQRARERLGEIDDRPRVERPPVLGPRDQQHPADAARDHAR